MIVDVLRLRGVEHIDQEQICAPVGRLCVREWLREDVRGHKFTVRAIHFDVVGLKLLMQPRNTDPMRASDMCHIGVFTRTTNSAAGVVVLKH